MRKNRSIVHQPRAAGGELERRTPIPYEGQPVAVYINHLAPDSRPAMLSGLRHIVAMVDPTKDLNTFPWYRLRYQVTKAIKARLREHYQPRSINRMLSAL